MSNRYLRYGDQRYIISKEAEARLHRSLAAVYADRFDLTRDEWRVLAQLADGEPMKSTELGLRTSLPKMQEVSRQKKVEVLLGYVRDAALFENHAGEGFL